MAFGSTGEASTTQKRLELFNASPRIRTEKPHCNVLGGRPKEVATGLAPLYLLQRRLRLKRSLKAARACQPSCRPTVPHPPATPWAAVLYLFPAAWIMCAHVALPAPICNISGCQFCLHCPAGACMGCGAARSPHGRSPPTDGPGPSSWRQLPLRLCCCWRIVDAPGNHQAIAQIVKPDMPGLGSSHLKPVKAQNVPKMLAGLGLTAFHEQVYAKQSSAAPHPGTGTGCMGRGRGGGWPPCFRSIPPTFPRPPPSPKPR